MNVSCRAGAALPEYTRVRVPDDHAIADLAMYNYIEVVNTPSTDTEAPLVHQKLNDSWNVFDSSF